MSIRHLLFQKKGLEVCAQCDEYPCARSKKETGPKDSFITHRKVLHNLAAIRESGLEPFLQQQARRIAILENMLQQYDDGRSKSYYCIAAALLSIAGLAQSIQRAEQGNKPKIYRAEQFESKGQDLEAVP